MSLNLMERRRFILNETHIETTSGNPVLFSTDVRAVLPSYKIAFIPTQDGNGTPDPMNIRNISHPGNVAVTANEQAYSIEIPVDAEVNGAFVGGEIYSNGVFAPSHIYYKWKSAFAASQITSISTIGSYTRFWIFAAGALDKLPDVAPICNILPSASSQGYENYNTEESRIGYSNNYPRSFWCIMPTSLVGKTATTIRNYLANKIEVAYPCVVSGSYSTSCPVIHTIKGMNSIGHNLSGAFQVKYWTH